MDIKVIINDKETEKLSVADSVFNLSYNEPLVHQVLTSYIAGLHHGSKAQKSRSQVRGGGRKPWRQKGTGRARAGTIRSPLWRGGGVTFAANGQKHSKKINKKMYRGAMRMILSQLITEDRLLCVEQFKIDNPKTKLVKEKLDALNLKQVLIINDGFSEDLWLGVRNLVNVEIVDVRHIEPYNLIRFEKLLVTKVAMEKIEAQLS